MPHTPSTGSACHGEFTACSVLAGCLFLPGFLDPAQLDYLQGTLATRLNNLVNSLHMQNMQRNLVSWVFLKEFGTASFWLLKLERAGRGLPLPLPKNGHVSGVMTRSLLRYAAR